MTSVASPLVMYVILRADLAKSLGWPMGAVIGQACHAATACLWTYRDHENMQAYVRDLDRMHKVTLQVADEPALRSIMSQLDTHQLLYHAWTEEPEHMLTAVAVLPYRKSEYPALVSITKSCRLFK